MVHYLKREELNMSRYGSDAIVSIVDADTVFVETSVWYKKAWAKHIGLYLAEEPYGFYMTRLARELTFEEWRYSRYITAIRIAIQGDNCMLSSTEAYSYSDVAVQRLGKLKNQMAQHLFSFCDGSILNADQHFFDLHSGNFMKSYSGKIYLIDPIATLTASL
jgi:hypothetical protein